MSAIKLAICDDHPVFRAGLISVLREESDLQLLVEAGGVNELKEKLGKQSVDLILLDFEMPGRTGLDALPELTPKARVLMISARDDPARVKQAIQAGAAGFVRKDVPPTELLQSIRDAAAGKTVMNMDMAMRLAEALRGDPTEREFGEKIRSLPQRQREVLKLLADGLTNKAIGEKLYISEGTVKNYVTQILQSVGVSDRVKLAVLIARHGVDFE